MEIREATVVTRIFCGNDKCGRLKLRKFPLKFYSFFSSGNYQVFQTPSSRRLFYRDLQLFFHLCNSHWFIRATIFLTINYRRKFFSVILLFSRDSDPSFFSITSKRNRKGVMEDILKTSFSFLPLFIYLFIYLFVISLMGKFIGNKTRVKYLIIWSSHPLNETFDDRLAISSLLEWHLKNEEDQDTARERIERRKWRISLWL